MATGDVSAADLAVLESAQRSRLLTALAALLKLGHSAQPRPWRDDIPPTPLTVSWSVLTAAQRSSPQAVEEVLRDPAVGACAFHLLRTVAQGSVPGPAETVAGACARLFGSMAAAAAIRAGLRCSLRVPARRGRLWLPSLGLTGAVGRGEWPVVGVESRPHGTVVFGDSGSLRLPDDVSRPVEGWSPLPVAEPADDGRRVALDHLSPHRDFRGLHDPAPLPAEDLSRWRDLLREAVELLKERHPGAYRAVTTTVRSLVPVDGPSALRVVSATVPDAYGAVTMSLPADAASLAVTLVHEVRHQLLSSVDDLMPLLAPAPEGPEPTYFAPWRGDPRPLRGLLYGAHAFAGVTAFWQARRERDGDRADFEFAFHRWQLRTALAALGGATGLTEAGGRIVTALAHAVRPLWAEQVDGPGGRLAELCCRDLVAGWRAAHLVVRPGEADELARRWSAGLSPPRALPGARMGTSRPGLPGNARIWLARLRCTDQQAFKQACAALETGATSPFGIADATPADAALVSQDTAKARHLYRRAAPSPDAWIGLGLAADPPTSLLVERPELVLALHAALLRRGVQPPGPEELAGWLGS
ncbi:aKG-HExxH-type peptide beta-hydroxylase [Nonomuraea sp. NPDC049684]|uniref:aKG-HExxH-type peptide beta-hydroxylase n=1 Tax=Nonomuraea sp. NPDC049684 TaxID=3364356 RepID=UPI00378DBDAA